VKWKPIEELDPGKMDFVIVTQDGAVRMHLWNPFKRAWERPYPVGSIVQQGEDCFTPTHWMELPDLP